MKTTLAVLFLSANLAGATEPCDPAKPGGCGPNPVGPPIGCQPNFPNEPCQTVPEPGTVLVLGAGLAYLKLRRR